MSEDKKSNIPAKESAQWKKNEKIINSNSALKQARDIAEGLEKPAHKYQSAHGSTGRFTVGGGSQQYKDNWERIFGNKNKKDSDDEQE